MEFTAILRKVKSQEDFRSILNNVGLCQHFNYQSKLRGGSIISWRVCFY